MNYNYINNEHFLRLSKVALSVNDMHFYFRGIFVLFYNIFQDAMLKKHNNAVFLSSYHAVYVGNRIPQILKESSSTFRLACENNISVFFWRLFYSCDTGV